MMESNGHTGANSRAGPRQGGGQGGEARRGRGTRIGTKGTRGQRLRRPRGVGHRLGFVRKGLKSHERNTVWSVTYKKHSSSHLSHRLRGATKSRQNPLVACLRQCVRTRDWSADVLQSIGQATHFFPSTASCQGLHKRHHATRSLISRTRRPPTASTRVGKLCGLSSACQAVPYLIYK